MTDISKATPRPWQWSGKSIAWVHAEDRIISERMHPANAALLVRAVNSHDALVDALRTISNINNGPDRASGEWRCQEAAVIARAALAAAGEPQP